MPFFACFSLIRSYIARYAPLKINNLKKFYKNFKDINLNNFLVLLLFDIKRSCRIVTEEIKQQERRVVEGRHIGQPLPSRSFHSTAVKSLTAYRDDNNE